MTLAVWCDAQGQGHPLDPREAIIITSKYYEYHFCRDHSVLGFLTAFLKARDDGKAGILLPLPELGGIFTIVPSGDPSAPSDQPGEAKPGEAGKDPAQEMADRLAGKSRTGPG